MTGRTTIAIVCVVILGGAWIATGPYRTLTAIRDAAKIGDAEELRERIDFNSVREGLRAQFNAIVAESIAHDPEVSPFGALGAALAGGMVNQMIDSLLTPEGIARFASGEMAEKTESSSLSQGSPAESPKEKVEWDYSFDSLSRFRATFRLGNPSDEVMLIVRRRGLSWVLTGINLPRNLAALQVAPPTNDRAVEAPVVNTPIVGEDEVGKDEDALVLLAGGEPEDGTAPLKVRFKVESLIDDRMNRPLYKWDFGDGSPVSNEPSPTHVFAKPGRYTTTIRIVDGDGQLGWDEIDIDVD